MQSQTTLKLYETSYDTPPKLEVVSHPFSRDMVILRIVYGNNHAKEYSVVGEQLIAAIHNALNIRR